MKTDAYSYLSILFIQPKGTHSVATWSGPMLGWLVCDRAGIQTHSLWLQNPQFFTTAIPPLEVVLKHQKKAVCYGIPQPEQCG